MSAFMCEDSVFAKIAGFPVTYGIRPIWAPFGDQGHTIEQSPTYAPQVAQILKWANVESLRCRYPSDYHDMIDGTDFTWPAVNFPHLDRPLAHYTDAELGAILKACDCYDYQACEVENYTESQAAALVDNVRRACIGQLSGYRAAKWGE